LEDHVRDVLEQAMPRAEVIHRLGTEYQVGIQLVGYFYNDYPGFGVNRDLISDLARLNVGIDCDFYYLYFDSREDS
jgi:hypothetical protein